MYLLLTSTGEGIPPHLLLYIYIYCRVKKIHLLLASTGEGILPHLLRSETVENGRVHFAPEGVQGRVVYLGGGGEFGFTWV